HFVLDPPLSCLARLAAPARLPLLQRRPSRPAPAPTAPSSSCRHDQPSPGPSHTTHDRQAAAPASQFGAATPRGSSTTPPHSRLRRLGARHQPLGRRHRRRLQPQEERTTQLLPSVLYRRPNRPSLRLPFPLRQRSRFSRRLRFHSGLHPGNPQGTARRTPRGSYG